MAFPIQRQNGVPVMVITGHLTDEFVDELIATGSEQLDRPGAQLVLDLTGMQYVNSSGLGGLIRLAAQANTQQQRVIIAGPTDFVRDLFALTRLDKFLEIAPSVGEALTLLEKN